MKKLYLAIAVLMALALFSCDFTPKAPGAEPVEYTEDGRPLVSLTIGRPNMSKALTAELARRGVDFYEVAFKDPLASPAKYYRASWDYTQTGKIKVPAGTYTGAANAVLFAGRYSDMTLLAVARISAVNGTAIGAGAATITATTTSVTFTLTPLLTNVHGGVQGAAGDSTNSSFLITGPAGFITTTVYATTELPDAKFVDKTIPIFKIPNDATATATFGLSLGGSAVFTDYNTAIQVEAGGTVKFAGVSANNYPPALLDLNNTKITAPAPTAPATVALPATIAIDLVSEHNDGSDNGLCKIAIIVPVIALGTTEFPHHWYIRGGLNNSDYDLGAAESLKAGGSILLGVGNISDDGIEILIN